MTDCPHNEVPGFCMACGFPDNEVRRLTRELNDAEAIHKDQWCKIDTLTVEVRRLRQACETIAKIAQDQSDPIRRAGPVREMPFGHGSGWVQPRADESKRLDAGRQEDGDDLSGMPRDETEAEE